MSTPSETRRPIVDRDVLRRAIHLVILTAVIVGIRAYGGAASAEDRLGAATQWFVEKTGLAAAKERWDKSIRPPIAAFTGAASESLYQSLARSMENASTTTDQGASWIGDITSRAIDALAAPVRAAFFPRVEPGKTEPAASPQPARPSTPGPPQ
jgi:hypothetical protein